MNKSNAPIRIPTFQKVEANLSPASFHSLQGKFERIKGAKETSLAWHLVEIVRIESTLRKPSNLQKEGTKFGLVMISCDTPSLLEFPYIP